jgi:cytochrome c556
MKTLRYVTIVVLALIAAAALALGQGAFNSSAFGKVMDDAVKNLRVVMGSLIAEDWAKAQSAAERLAADAGTIHGLTPKVSPDRIGEFQAHADSLAARSAVVAAAAKAHDRDGASQGLGRVVQTCMACHSVFRK